MEKEIALPFPDVLDAIDILESQDVLLLGWEPHGAYEDGGYGAYPSPSFGGFTLPEHAIPDNRAEWQKAVHQSAQLHRTTIRKEWQQRESTPPAKGVELIFCV